MPEVPAAQQPTLPTSPTSSSAAEAAGATSAAIRRRAAGSPTCWPRVVQLVATSVGERPRCRLPSGDAPAERNHHACPTVSPVACPAAVSCPVPRCSPGASPCSAARRACSPRPTRALRRAGRSGPGTAPRARPGRAPGPAAGLPLRRRLRGRGDPSGLGGAQPHQLRRHGRVPCSGQRHGARAEPRAARCPRRGRPAGRAHAARVHLRPAGARRHHDDHGRPRRPPAGRVRVAGRDVDQLRRRCHPVADLALVRGDRGPRRGERVTPRTTATSSRSTPRTATPTGTRSRSRRSGGSRTRPSPSTRRHATMYLTEDAATPNGLFYRWTPPRGFRAGKGALRRLGPTDGAFEAMPCTDAAGHPDRRPVAGHRGRHDLRVSWTAVPDRDARAVPTRLQLPRRRSPAAASSRALVGRRRRLRRRELRPRREPGTPRRPGVVPRPAARHPDPQAPLRGQPEPRPGRHELRRAGQHHRLPLGRSHPRRGRRGRAAPGRRHRGRPDLPDRPQRPNTNEMAGPVYSRDKRILFANLYEPGICYAITGPWRKQR